MGAWGEKAFENDSALDWLNDLEEEGVSALRGILETVAETGADEYVDVDDGSAAVAASEIVAAALGYGRDRLTKPVRRWLDANPDAIVADDLLLARAALERVVAAGSELLELWNDGGPDSEWHTDVGVLMKRIGARTPEPRSAESDADPLDGGDIETSKQLLLAFLAMRGLVPDASQLTRIHDSTDPAEVARWINRSRDAASVRSLLDD